MGSHALVLLSIKAQMDSKFVVAALSGRFHSVNGNDCRREASRWKIKRTRVDSRPGRPQPRTCSARDQLMPRFPKRIQGCSSVLLFNQHVIGVVRRNRKNWHSL